jgi:hypothetical protein
MVRYKILDQLLYGVMALTVKSRRMRDDSLWHLAGPPQWTREAG